MQQTNQQATSTFNPSSKDEVICDYINAGTTLLVLRGKIPVAKEWTRFASDKPQTPKDFPANYGVLLEEDDLVIDYDPRNDKTPGKIAYQNLVNYVNTAFDTYTVKTGGGGLHVYLKKPKNILVLNELCTDPAKAKPGEKCYPEFSGLEFKSVGRQVVGPQSVHPTTGEKYTIEWKRPSDERMQAPQALLDLIERPADNFGIDLDAESMGAFTDDDQSVGRYVDFLGEAPPAVEGCGGDLHTYKMACRGRDFNLSPAKTFELMLSYFNPKCLPSWDEKDLWIKVKSAYINNKDVQGKWSPELAFDLEDVPEGLKKAPLFWRDKDGKPKKMLCNIISYMQMEENPLYDLLQYNLFTKNIEFKARAPWHTVDGQCWSDDDAIHFKAWLSEVKEFEMNTFVIHEAALAVAVKSAYHPIQSYLESLEWDGTKRLGTWISEYCDTEENPYTRAIGEKVLVAAVTRIFNPGTKFDHVLIIEGPQGVGKSTLVSILGKYWYGDIIIDPHNKDTVDALRSKWIVEISEMECAKREISALKRFITCTSDRVRPAYARSSQDFPRQCVFVGTINPENGRGYLKDPTGNRRYWPVHVSAVDFIRLRKDIDQLWAEAVQVFKKGTCKLYLETKELQDFANTQTEERFEADPIEEVIGNYLEDTQLERITTAQIMQDCLIMPLSKLDKFYAGRIACAMNRLGFENVTRRIDGKVARCYVKISKKQKNELNSNEEISSQESQNQDGLNLKQSSSNSSNDLDI